jgi:N-acetylglucosamine-6-phosphate deacetylase
VNHKLLKNARVVLPDKDKIMRADVTLEGTKIREVGNDLNIPENSEVIDLEGKYLSPGFIDLQVNGAAGVDFLTCQPEEVKRAGKTWLEHGVTSFLGTIITQGLDEMHAGIERLSSSGTPNLLGVHVEGPFLSEEKRGTHNPAHVREPDRSSFDRIIKNCEEDIELFTFAPEIDGGEQLLNWIKSEGFVPSIGHSTASYETALDFVGKGVNSFTHLFNGMKGIHHRRPGTAGAGLNSSAFTGVIADGLHLHPGAIELVEKIKSEKRVYLVSDAIAAAGMEDGQYVLGDQEITVEDGLAKLDDGTIAGSTLTLDRAVENYVNFSGATLLDAVRAVTLNPARLLGKADQIGTMKEGSRADLVVFDENYEVKYTLVEGEVLF